MARQNYAIKGTIGGMIFYTYNGVPVVRSKPARVRQTKATKQCSEDFGKAARFSKELRSSIGSLTNLSRDRSLMYRMNKILYHWLRESRNDNDLLAKNIGILEDLELNEQTIPARRIKFKSRVSFDNPEKILVVIPQLQPSRDIICPAQC